MSACAYCGEDKELRLYGRRGESICFGCAMSPEHKQTTERMFTAQLEASGSVVIVGEETGPRPFQGGGT